MLKSKNNSFSLAFLAPVGGVLSIFLLVSLTKTVFQERSFAFATYIPGMVLGEQTDSSGEVKAEITKGNTTVKFVDKDGVLKKEVVSGDDEQRKSEDEVADNLTKEAIRVSSEAGSSSLSEDGFEAKSDFPLLVNVDDKRIEVLTSEGKREVKLMPKAIGESIGSSVATKAKYELASNKMKLRVLNGEPVYEAEATRDFKFLSIFTVTRPVKVILSAKDGSVVSEKQSYLSNLIELMSF